MEKQANTYRLAKCYNKSLQRSHNKRDSLPQMPTYINQPKNHNTKYGKKQQSNMFMCNLQDRLRTLDIENQKPYEYVGIKQMKEFVVRSHKKKKNHTQSIKLNLSSALQSTVNSINTKEKINFLTKNQLIGCLTKQKKYQSIQQTYLCDQTTSNFTSLNSSKIVSPSKIKYQQSTEKNLRIQKVSLKKVKSNLQKYIKSWNDQITNRQNDYKNIKDHKNHKKINSSLLNDSQKYRKIRQKQQKLNILQHINNIQPRQWNSILRKDISLQKNCLKDLQHIIKNDWTINGANKLKTQINWIREKDKQGHFFKKQKISQGNKKFN